jgi:hypothetical protein
VTVIYEITAAVNDDLIEAYELYMRDHHIPDLMATGLFTKATFSRSQPGRYRICYDASGQELLDEYLSQHAARLREDLKSHFPAGVELAREIWKVVEVFEK